MVAYAPTAPTAPAATPPQANIRAAGAAFPPDEFHTIQNVTVFAEHETTSRDGRRLRFGPAELAAVCERCNQRIRDTGDYAAVVIGHTPAPGDRNGKEPELIGFAGPFRVARLPAGEDGDPGDGSLRGRVGIMATLHIYKEDVHKLKKYPRRSPELWLEDRYEEMFLDPIALLGAEAPRLDMGLLYSAMYHGRLRERYTAVAPAAGNVAIRDDDLSPPEHYQQEDTPIMLGPEDIRQIVEALEQLDWVQGVKQLLDQNAGTNATFGPEPTPPPAEPAGMAPQPPGATPPGEPPNGLPATPADAPPAAPGGESPAMPPSPAPEVGPPSGDIPPEAPDADQDRERMRRYAALDELDLEDDEIEEYVRGRKRRKGRRKHYEAGDVDPGDEGNPAAADVEGTLGPHGTGAADDETDAAGEYQTARPPQKYQRNGEVLALRRELDAMKQRLERTHSQVEQERGARIDAERYSMLAERRSMYAFDLDREVDRCRYGKMSDQQFSEHLEGIEENYKPIPIGEQIPTFTPQAQRAADTAPNRPGAGAARERYSKEHSDQARAWCERRATAGLPYDYGTALEALRAGKTLPE